MKLSDVRLVTFSPTGTTKRVLAAVAEGLAAPSVKHLDLTLPSAETLAPTVLTDDVVVIGAPVYAGRIPATATARLQALRGDGTLAILVVVYGNRAFDDALLELSDWATDAGFVPIAGAAFIGEHSYNTDQLPIAPGRPDAADLAEAQAFGESVCAHLDAVSDRDALVPAAFPGDRPYRARKPDAAISPVTLPDLCTLCGRCAEVCPTAAITVDGDVVTDVDACIVCCACVRACPTAARVLTDARIVQTAEWLSREHGDRKSPEVFL